MNGLLTFGYILAALVMLGLLITLHEAGHYFMARWCGIEVKEFAIGMGPKIWSRVGKKTGTKFSLRALPIGGFCMYYGEDEDNADPRAYNMQPVWKRFLSVLAGPGMNFIVGFVLVLVLLSVWGVTTTIPTVDTLVEGKPAVVAGLQPGDVIVSVDGTPIENTAQMTQLVTQGQGKPMTFVVRRGEEEHTFTIAPQFDEIEQRHMIGIAFAQVKVSMTVGQRIGWAYDYCKMVVVETFKALGGLFQGQGVDDMSGPVGIVNVIQQETRTGGFSSYLSLAVLISMNLGFMNLLPFPGLDGSRLVFFAVEALRRKPVNRNVEGMIHMVGVALLMCALLLFTYKDILRIFGAA